MFSVYVSSRNWKDLPGNSLRGNFYREALEVVYNQLHAREDAGDIAKSWKDQVGGPTGTLQLI